MAIYLTYRKIPELAGLTPLKRKLVYQCALECLFAEQPSTLWIGMPWILGGMAGGALAGWMLVTGIGLTHSNLLVIAAGGLGGALSGNGICTHWLHTQLRPYLRRVLEERKDEIAQIEQPR